MSNLTADTVIDESNVDEALRDLRKRGAPDNLMPALEKMFRASFGMTLGEIGELECPDV